MKGSLLLHFLDESAPDQQLFVAHQGMADIVRQGSPRGCVRRSDLLGQAKVAGVGDPNEAFVQELNRQLQRFVDRTVGIFPTSVSRALSNSNGSTP